VRLAMHESEHDSGNGDLDGAQHMDSWTEGWIHGQRGGFMDRGEEVAPLATHEREHESGRYFFN
jgi:hypothetical protein